MLTRIHDILYLINEAQIALTIDSNIPKCLTILKEIEYEFSGIREMLENYYKEMYPDKRV